MVPAPLNPARLKQMKAEASAGGDPLSGVPPSTDAYPKKRSRRRSIGKKPENNTETLVQQPQQGSREHRRSREQQPPARSTSRTGPCRPFPRTEGPFPAMGLNHLI